MVSATTSGTEGYASEAPSLLHSYEKLSFENVHKDVLDFLPGEPSSIIDIGAGTGRDAARFASLGHSVLAVEPTEELRKPAMLMHASDNIEWLDDSLPCLARVLQRGETFDLIMMTAVWMHLDAYQRNIAMSIIAKLTRERARVIMTLRHGMVPKGRCMFKVSGDETVRLGLHHGFTPLMQLSRSSVSPKNRAAGVTWTSIVLERT